MRLRRLNIHRYGHFAEAQLDFTGDGLQVICGHNEAGKSTLLQFVREVLFGFGERNPYAFLGEKLEGSAILEFTTRKSVELRRRKGRPDALTLRRDGQPESVSEAELQLLLGGANGPLFQKVFAFGLTELAEGEESLKLEAVQNALHGSGVSGLTNPQKILDQLTKDAEAIFKKGGSKQEVALISTDIKQQSTRLKERITRTETYLQRKRDYETARTEADDLAERLSQLRKDYAHLKRLATAFPLWRELAELHARRLELGQPPPLPPDARVRFDKVLEELKHLSKQSAKLEREIQSAEADLQKNPAQTEWLNLRSQIEQARELIKSVQEARRDLPLLEAELQANQRQVREGVEDIVSSWTVSQLEAFRCDAGQRSQCEQLAETRRELENERVRLEDRAASLAAEEVENQADLNAIGEVLDVTALQALLNGQADYVALETALKSQQKEAARQQRAIAAQIRKLTPPLPTGLQEIQSRAVPMAEQIMQFQQRFAEARQRVTVAEQSLDEARQRCAQLERDLATAKGSLIDLPTLDGLKQIRAHRDDGWTLIQKRYVDGQPDDPAEQAWLAPSSATLTAQFQQTLRRSDDYSDQMFNNASLVQKQEQVTAARNEVLAKQEDVNSRREAVEVLSAQWLDLWQQSGFAPLDPDAMLAWRAQFDQALELLERHADVQAEIAHQQAELQAFDARLQQVLPSVNGSSAERLAAAQAMVALAQQQAQDLKACKRQSAKLQKAVEQLKESRQLFTERQRAFDEQWRSWLEGFHFPVDWQPDLALTVISRLQHLRDKLQQIPRLEGRLTAMRQRLSEFDPFVVQLCEQVAPEWKAQPTEVAARHLADRLQSALDTDTRRLGLTRELQKHRLELEEKKEQQLAQQQERLRLLQLAAVDSEEAFLNEAQRLEQIHDLDQQIESKQRELTRLREFEDPAAFLAELERVDFPELELARQQFEQQISVLEEDERKANERKGATGRELEQLDGSSAAAEIQATIVQRRAALANAVDRYVPLLFAKQILQQSLQRFEKESQPELLNDVSRLFAAMTGGRYQRVERPRDANRPLVVYRTDNAEDLEPSQLSTGTREQLYLAIRLAYVLHYCTKAEPLPIVLDDVFANFDPGRTRNTLIALGQITDRVQVLLFTCHPHVTALAQDVFPDLEPVAMPRSQVAQR